MRRFIAWGRGLITKLTPSNKFRICPQVHAGFGAKWHSFLGAREVPTLSGSLCRLWILGNPYKERFSCLMRCLMINVYPVRTCDLASVGRAASKHAVPAGFCLRSTCIFFLLAFSMCCLMDDGTYLKVFLRSGTPLGLLPVMPWESSIAPFSAGYFQDEIHL